MNFNPIHELMALHAAGRFKEMETRARFALKVSSGSAILNELLGMALAAQRRFSDALPFLEKATRREAKDAQFWENLALCQFELDRIADCEKSLRRSLHLRPNSVEALNVLGCVLYSQDREDEALALFEQALAVEPRHSGACFNLARALQKKGELPAAEAAFRRAIALDRNNIKAYVRLADLLFGRGDKSEAPQVAEVAFRMLGGTKMAVDQSNVLLCDTLANTFAGLGQPAKALQICQAAFAFKPEPARALLTFNVARQLCEWDVASSVEPLARRLVDAPSATMTPKTLLNLPSATALDQLALGRKYASMATEKFGVASPPRIREAGRTNLRIGYFSTDFFNHATAHLISGVIEAHDRERFEIAAYDISPPIEDEYRERLKSAFDRFVPLRDLSDAAAAQRMAADGVDILVDLCGWIVGHRGNVLARRPAPIQIQWLGYPGTTGAPWIDYIVADRVLISPEDEQYYSEKVIRLPDSYQPNDDRRRMGEPLTRRDHGLADNAFVFCCFNQNYKITSEVFDVWMRLLSRVRDSVLWLLDPEPEAVPFLHKRAADHGVAADRLIFAPWASSADHIARARHADLALDCFPVGSHTTGSDMLCAGVPLIALKGGTFVSRVSSSLLTVAGLPDLITTSLSDYHDLALRLATDREALASVRSRLRNNLRGSALFDTMRFTRHLEAAFTAVWQRHERGDPPAPIDIDPAL